MYLSLERRQWSSSALITVLFGLSVLLKVVVTVQLGRAAESLQDKTYYSQSTERLQGNDD